ncbi:leucine-rich repeat domain-containing protein [Prevotella sp. OH937_COT-195]|uniref:leucine-rich repeat domain-containing protein n=1 Tax=Prevotella sp. OH937_COT-195 TaxID=2491051 RepID=UPI0013155C6C|nr:leucine-rich repeat domain-containing protein [Prevotella sp. OH937_COT-195]
MKVFFLVIMMFCTLGVSADNAIYLRGIANGTEFYLKVRSLEKMTVQLHASKETDYKGDIIIPEKIIANDGKEYTIDLIDKGVFTGNELITSVSIPGTVTEIGQYAFSGCTSLKSVTLGKGVERAFKYAFENCKSLETITFPISTLYFEKETFTGCENVKEVYLYDDNPRGVTGNDPFELIGQKAILFVPYGTRDKYQELYGWKDFTVSPFIVLDENETLKLEVRVENIRTIFKRSIKSDKWNSFCVPFNLSTTDIITLFGTGTRILEFDPNSTETTLNFVDAKSITANKPCLIKPVKSWSEYTFDNLTLEPSVKPNVTGVNYSFNGNYFNGDVPMNSYFISNNKFYKAVGDKNKLKGYRAYIMPVNSDGGAKHMDFTISSTTGIELIGEICEGKNNRVYDICGRPIYIDAPSSVQMKKGIYIKGDKKILIK